MQIFLNTPNSSSSTACKVVFKHKMELCGTNVVHFTPPREELLPNHKIFCAQPNCKSTFTNMGNYEMHLQRHHKIPQVKNEDRRQFWHCPESHCVYNESKEGGRHFPNLRYLRQHYQKVHAPKEHVCDCGKRFITVGQLLSHSEKVCGRKFMCNECGWDYASMEALQTHGKRTGHVIAADVKCEDSRKIVAIPRLKLKRSSSVDDVKCNQNQQTQTEEAHESKRVCITSVQTDSPVALQDATTSVSESCFSNELDSILRDIETQTERSLLHSNSNSAFFDHMLAQSSNMYTQTCDDFLSELGLTDIQTQTNWSNLSESEHKHQYASTSTSTGGGGAHDELLVSTETQTSFTQCLLDSCPIGSDNTTDGGGGVFGNIQHTQHTQTCDTLLDDLFGAQENDLICGFQSTYTQTS